MIITITGMPGSGKTTIAKMLSETLGIPWYSMGDLRGKMAKERGMTIDEFNILGEKEAFTDKEIDTYQKHLGQTKNTFIIDGRLSWYFIPHSFKVFLDIDKQEGAKRIFESSKKDPERMDEKKYLSKEEVLEALQKRIESDKKRYQKYYQVDIMKKEHYDLVVDTTTLSAKEVSQYILQALPKSA
jgi:cytidylate kinase